MKVILPYFLACLEEKQIPEKALKHYNSELWVWRADMVAGLLNPEIWRIRDGVSTLGSK